MENKKKSLSLVIISLLTVGMFLSLKEINILYGILGGVIGFIASVYTIRYLNNKNYIYYYIFLVLSVIIVSIAVRALVVKERAVDYESINGLWSANDNGSKIILNINNNSTFVTLTNINKTTEYNTIVRNDSLILYKKNDSNNKLSWKIYSLDSKVLVLGDEEEKVKFIKQ